MPIRCWSLAVAQWALGMASIGSGYDLASSTYSPDGRIFQVEYAGKAVESSGTVIGIKCCDGVVLAVEKILHSKLLKKRVNRRIMTVDLHSGFVAAGLTADCRQLGNRARDEAANFREVFGAPISGPEFAERLGLYLHAYTSYSSVRPYGTSAILGVHDRDGPQLYMFEPSGVYWGYRACAAGKGSSLAKTELEKLVPAGSSAAPTLTVAEAVQHAVRILHMCHEDSKETRDWEVEVSWIGPHTGFEHRLVPEDVLAAAEQKAKEAIEASMEYE